MPKLATHTELPDGGSVDREFDNIYRSLAGTTAESILTGNGAPNMIPTQIGQTYLDLTAKREYKSYGTNSVNDWILQPFPNSYIRRKGGTTRGSTNTNVIIYNTAVLSSGSDITYNNSATNGDYFAINTSGVYTVTACSVAPNATTYIQIRESSTLNNNVSYADSRSTTTLTANYGGTTTYTGYMAAGQKIWVISSETPANYSDLCAISIARVA